MNNKGLVGIIVFLIIVSLGLGGFIVYDKVLKNDKQIEIEENEPIDNSVEDEKNKKDDKMDDYMTMLNENVPLKIVSLISMLNYCYDNSYFARMSSLIDDKFEYILGANSLDGLDDKKKNVDLLQEIAPKMMYVFNEHHFFNSYNNLFNIAPIEYGECYLLDKDGYNELQKYFNVELDSNKIKNYCYDIDEKYTNGDYYFGFLLGDGFGCNTYHFELDEIKKINDNSKEIIFDVVDYEGKFYTKAKLGYTENTDEYDSLYIDYFVTY